MLNEQNRGIATVTLCAISVGVFVIFLTETSAELGKEGVVEMVMVVSQVVMMAFCPMFFVLHHIGVGLEALVLWAGFIGSAVLFMNNDYRMSKLLNSGHWQTNNDDCMETEGVDICSSESLLILPLVLITISVSALTRSSRSWPLPMWQVALYVTLSWTQNLRPGPGKFHFYVGAALIAVCFLSWTSRRQAEVWVRLFWIENQHLHIELERKESMAMSQERRLLEVNECLEAMSSGVGLDREEAFAQVRTVRTEVDAIPSAPVQNLTLPSPQSVTVLPSIVASPVTSNNPNYNSPNPRLEAAMAGRSADVARIQRMAEQIKDKAYSLKHFCDDCLGAFPELDLYFTAPKGERGTSGRTGEVEYQRTLGALFGVYWLVRLDVDGKCGFCFGVDDNWQVKTPTMGRNSEHTNSITATKSRSAKRHEFYYHADWKKMQDIVTISVGTCPQRIAAMLCLSAIHDIMKMSWLLPSVTAEHGPYKGFQVGSVLHDHDLALSYLLEFFPHVLPSYRFLSADMKETILFSVSKMQFNHGWFVQAEAPPGPCLSALKGMLAGSKPGDFYFYFLHWLTDLSGAEGTPKGGAEKLVLKFPLPVLKAFLWSIPYLQELHTKTETVAFEDYLAARWERTFPDRPLPLGSSRVALLRLTVMAQASAGIADKAFHRLPADTQTLLSTELSRTGKEGQLFPGSPMGGGPALLVYYGPAILQGCDGEDDMFCALSVLAAVFHGGRQLWPASLAKQNDTVVLNISQLKAKSIWDIAGCPLTESKEIWVLVQKNTKEAMVELMSVGAINELNENGCKYWILDLHVSRNQDERTVSASRLRTISAARKLLERVLWL